LVFIARLIANHFIPDKAGMSQPTRPFPQGTITEIRLEIDYGSRLSPGGKKAGR
jgi:hypothetical protein